MNGLPEGLYFKTLGRFFKVVAAVDSDAAANVYMVTNPGTGLLAIEGTLRLIAKLDDKGVKA